MLQRRSLHGSEPATNRERERQIEIAIKGREGIKRREIQKERAVVSSLLSICLSIYLSIFPFHSFCLLLFFLRCVVFLSFFLFIPWFLSVPSASSSHPLAKEERERERSHQVDPCQPHQCLCLHHLFLSFFLFSSKL